MKTETKTKNLEPDDKASDYNTHTKMLFAIRAINVIVKAVRDRNPILDEYTSAGLENIEAWAEYGLLLQMEDSPNEH